MAEKQLKNLIDRLQALPFVTIGIIIVNVIVMIFSYHHLNATVINYGLIPSELSFPRMLNANFIHAGLVHLSINMFLLYLFGRHVERAMGKLEFLLFYLGACFAASLLHILIVVGTLPPYYATRAVVGASGAVSGVMGIYAVRFHRKIFNFGGLELPALFVVMSWLGIQLGMGVLGLYRDDILGMDLKRVGYWSHLGGFGFGFIVAILSSMALKGEREYLIEEAEQNYDLGNLLEAIQNYESLLKYDPVNAFAHAELGRFWAILEEEDQSIPFYKTAIELYLSQGKDEEAIEKAEEMKRFWFTAKIDAPIRLRLASYLEESGQHKPAIEAFQDIVRECAHSPEAQMALLKVGHLQLCSLGDPTSAISTLEEFQSQYPNSEWTSFAEEILTRAKAVSEDNFSNEQILAR